MPNSKLACVVLILVGGACVSHGQQAENSRTPLAGEALRNALAGRYMVMLDWSPQVGEHFCEDGRWKYDGHRVPSSGTYEIRGDVYCVTVTGISGERCGQIFHLEDDRYVYEAVPPARGKSEVQLQPEVDC